MFILKDILYGIKTRKNSAVLTVIQLTFTLFISYSILNIYFDGAIVNSSNRWALNDIEEIYLINAKDDSIVRRDNDLYIELVEKINEEEKGLIGAYSTISLYIESLNDYDIIGVSINEDYYNMLNENFIQGKGFNGEDFLFNPSNPIPIILGNDYKNKCKINDVFEDKYSGQKYIVVGFLKANKYFIESNYYLSSYINSKNSFIVPMSENSPPIGSKEFFIKFNDNEEKIINSDEIIIKNMKEAIKSDLNGFFESNKQWIPFLIISVFIALIGVIISTILSITFRRREFGIRIVLGENFKAICLKVISENIILSIIASILTIFLTYIININFIKATRYNTVENIVFINFNMTFFIPIVLTIIIINIFTSLILFEILKRVQPKELIGGTE